MIDMLFGGKLDIHGGGIDLKFPHHNNELIQTSAYLNNTKWAKYFLHSGHLYVAGEKMSQSLNNFKTITSFLQTYTARQLRLLFLMHKWNAQCDLSDHTIKNMIELDDKLNNFFENVNFTIKSLKPVFCIKDDDLLIDTQINSFFELFNKALSDDFNTVNAILHLRLLMSNVNNYMNNSPSPSLLQNMQNKLLKLLDDVFGLDYQVKQKQSNNDDELKKTIIEIRDVIRQNANMAKESNIKKQLFELSDWIRNVRLRELNISIEDTKNGAKVN